MVSCLGGVPGNGGCSTKIYTSRTNQNTVDEQWTEKLSIPKDNGINRTTGKKGKASSPDTTVAPKSAKTDSVSRITQFWKENFKYRNATTTIPASTIFQRFQTSPLYQQESLRDFNSYSGTIPHLLSIQNRRKKKERSYYAESTAPTNLTSSVSETTNRTY